MSLSKLKEAAQQAIKTLKTVESLLPYEQREPFRNALEAVARHNVELRQAKTLIQSKIEQQPIETALEKQLKRELDQRSNENDTLRRQLEIVKKKSKMWTDKDIHDVLIPLSQDATLENVELMTNIAAWTAITAAFMGLRLKGGPEIYIDPDRPLHDAGQIFCNALYDMQEWLCPDVVACHNMKPLKTLAVVDERQVIFDFSTF